MWEAVLKGVMLGFATGGYCLGACGPIFIPYLFSEERSFKNNLNNVIEFLSGRFIAYIIFGILAGYFGAVMQTEFSRKIISISMIILALLLMIFAITRSFPDFGLCKVLSRNTFLKRFPFLSGFLIGITPCPPFLEGISYLLGLGGMLLGIIFFSGFFIGTSVYLIPLIFTWKYTKMEQLRNASIIASFLAGIWFVFEGIILLYER